MSFNSNFSYYNLNTQNNWWGANDANKSKYEASRVIDYTNKSYVSGYPTQSFSQQMILPNENHISDSSHSRHEVVHGKVTQLFASFGYINDNIIFSKTDVSGPMVKVGDQVIVEASYQPNNPMKYKGERVIKMDNQRSNNSSNTMKMKTLSRDNPPSRNYDRREKKIPEKRKMDSNNKSRPSLNSKMSKPIPKKSIEKYDSKKAPPKVEEPKKIIEKSPVIPKEPIRNTIAVKKKPSREAKETKVKPRSFKPNLSLKELDCSSIKYEHGDLQLPKHFFHLSLKFQNSFPLNHPMKLGNKCPFKILDKKVDCVDKYVNKQLGIDIDPEDADTTFVAKVILISMDDLSDFYKQTLQLAEEFDGVSKIPITKAIKFLVASKGENNEFGIGGSWSPSLDGSDPEGNSRVLINTAIRTVKGLTGIDLSGCSSWQKFLEFHYYRPMEKLSLESGTSENDEMVQYREPKMETVVYYIPDIWNCLPSQESWNSINKMYQEQLANILCPPPPTPPQISVSAPKPSSKEYSIEDPTEEEDYNFNDNEESNTSEFDSTVSDKNPTHFSKLDVDTMKVAELKRELEYRKMNNRGVMAQLKARLKSVLEKEEVEEKNKENPVTVKSTEVSETVDLCTLSEFEKADLKAAYQLPDTPKILVHQNRKLTENNFKIKLMSLHSLLSYQNVTLNEQTFELAIFARQFLQMIKRDAIFNVYKYIVVTPEKEFKMSEEKNDSKKFKSMVTTSKRTIDRPLLFSCTVIDREHTDIITVDELTTMFESLGICLSTNQLDSIIGKIKDNGRGLQYRNLTDREVNEEEMSKMLNLESSEDLDYIKELAMGNKALFENDELPRDVNYDREEVERLKNQLDKSERCRQTLELRMCEVREETEKSISQNQSLTVEVDKLRSQLNDYRKRYHIEQERGDHYKHTTEKFKRDIEDIKHVSDKLTRIIGETVDRYSDRKKDSKAKSISKTRSTTKDNKTKSNNEDSEMSNCNIMILDDDEKMDSNEINSQSDIIFVDCTVDTPIESINEEPKEVNIEENVENGNETNPITNEDFDLSKPDDIVILDETE